MSGLRNFSLTVTRPAPGAYVDGVYAAGAPSTFAVRASVQPLRGRELEALPEGRRSRAAYRVYTDTLLRTVDDANPDRIALFGEAYEVIAIEHWQNGILPHYKAVLSKLDHAPEPA
ncbi:MAG TPA: hypothetical protein VFT43_09590 [Candidatus Polarisedimenticolia bacterium]|nr:hypothetical protein [Candidatus Polarisedimenticolia bacterium]